MYRKSNTLIQDICDDTSIINIDLNINRIKPEIETQSMLGIKMTNTIK